MQDKLKELQSTLESAENERSHTEQKYEEVKLIIQILFYIKKN